MLDNKHECSYKVTFHISLPVTWPSLKLSVVRTGGLQRKTTQCTNTYFHVKLLHVSGQSHPTWHICMCADEILMLS